MLQNSGLPVLCHGSYWIPQPQRRVCEQSELPNGPVRRCRQFPRAQMVWQCPQAHYTQLPPHTAKVQHVHWLALPGSCVNMFQSQQSILRRCHCYSLFRRRSPDHSTRCQWSTWTGVEWIRDQIHSSPNYFRLSFFLVWLNTCLRRYSFALDPIRGDFGSSPSRSLPDVLPAETVAAVAAGVPMVPSAGAVAYLELCHHAANFFDDTDALVAERNTIGNVCQIDTADSGVCNLDEDIFGA